MPKQQATGTIAIADGADLRYGGNVTFDTEVDGLQGTQYPMVYVACWQDDVKVYGELNRPDDVFKMGGGSSQWIVNGGGPATCQASIRTYGGKGKTPYSTILETIEFEVEG